MSGGEVLNVPPGLYGGSECGVNIYADNVTIRASPGEVVIDCNGEERHLTVYGQNVNIEGLILVNGSSKSEECTDSHRTCSIILDGGCILIFGNNTLIRNSTVSGCRAARHGGGISVPDNDVHIEFHGVVISNSTAQRGAGIWSHGHLTLMDCSFIANTASGDGGAVSVQGPGASLFAMHTLFSRNVALRGCGGGIAAMTKNSTLDPSIPCVVEHPLWNYSFLALSDGVTFTGNKAGGQGGAVYAQDGVDLLIHGERAEVLFERNSAKRGGALYTSLVDHAISGRVVFRGNAATGEGDGGAVHVDCGCRGYVAGNTLFEGNSASPIYGGYGGGIFVSLSTIDIAGNVTFVGNKASASPLPPPCFSVHPLTSFPFLAAPSAVSALAWQTTGRERRRRRPLRAVLGMHHFGARPLRRQLGLLGRRGVRDVEE
jgi:predicted outer membrane repeat protein